MDNRPIGIFDSGVGGITILKEIQKRLPNENYIYLGDTKNFPYGEKNREEIINCKIVYHRFTFHDWLTPYKMNAFKIKYKE